MRSLNALMLALVLFGLVRTADAAPKQPNILWIIVDDMSANFSCYGETAIETPNVDRLAARGNRFSQAFVTAPVCSTCRSAFITGMYQTSIGAHHHRSGRGEKKIHLPTDIVPVPKLFQQAGYYTSVGSWPNRKGRLGKTDYNFVWDQSMYDGADWSGRAPGQPFFAQIQLPGGKLRGGTIESSRRFRDRTERELGSRTPLDAVELPPYYPDEPVLIEDWAAYLDSVRYTDMIVGQILDRIEYEGMLDETVVIFMTDHGISHARGKQFLYDEGLHVPLVIAGPGVGEGLVRDDLVEHIDIAATSLGLAGISVPESMQARDILAEDYQPREVVFAARDRCDETVDHLRSVRSNRFKYIRNFLPERPHLQPNAYKDRKSILIALREAHLAGRLDDVQEQLFASTRPTEELYDLASDPHEVHNLAGDPAFDETLRAMRRRLERWMEETGDQGRTPEAESMFESDMSLYVGTLRRRKADPEHIRQVEENIELMRRRAAEGK